MPSCDRLSHSPIHSVATGRNALRLGRRDRDGRRFLAKKPTGLARLVDSASEANSDAEGILLVMGLFGAYLAYRHGRKKAERRADMQSAREELLLRKSDPTCESCGYRLSKHSDDGQNLCPSYK